MSAKSERNAKCPAEFTFPGSALTTSCKLHAGHRDWHVAPLDRSMANDPPTDFSIQWESFEDTAEPDRCDQCMDGRHWRCTDVEDNSCCCPPGDDRHYFEAGQ